MVVRALLSEDGGDGSHVAYNFSESAHAFNELTHEWDHYSNLSSFRHETYWECGTVENFTHLTEEILHPLESWHDENCHHGPHETPRSLGWIMTRYRIPVPYTVPE